MSFHVTAVRSNRGRSACLSAALFAVVLFCSPVCSPVGAQIPAEISAIAPAAPLAEVPPPVAPTAAVPAPGEISLEDIAARRKRVEETVGLEEPVKAELLKRYKQAQDWITTAQEANKKTAEFRAEIEAGPKLAEQLKSQLDKAPAESPPEIPAGATLVQLEQLFAQSQEQLKTFRENLVQQETAIKQRTERKAKQAKLIDETAQRLAEAEKQVEAQANSDDVMSTVAARYAEMAAQRRMLRRQLELQKIESQRNDALVEVFPLQRDLAQRAVARAEKQTAAWQAIVTEHRRLEAERQARETRRQLANAHPQLRHLAEENAALVARRAQMAEEISRLTQQFQACESLRADLAAEFDKITAKLNVPGMGTTVGLMLRKQRGRLPDLQEYRQRSRQIEKDMPSVQMDMMELEEQRAAMGDLAVVEDQLLAAMVDADPERLRQMVNDLLQSKRQYLDDLLIDYNAYVDKLSELQVGTNKLIEQTKEQATYIDEHILWIRSADVVGPADFVRSAAGVSALISVKQWKRVAEKIFQDFRQSRILSSGVLVLGLALVAGGQRLRRRVRLIGQRVPERGPVRFAPTVDVLVCTLLICSVWPLSLILLGMRLSDSPLSDSFVYAVGVALTVTAICFWTAALVRQVCRSHGLGAKHFGWAPRDITKLRAHLRRLMWFALPLVFVTTFAETYQEGRWSNSLGRISFVLAMLALAIFNFRILHPIHGALRETYCRRPNGGLYRFRHVSQMIGTILPLIMVGLAISGYYFTALRLTVQLEATFCLLVVITITGSMLSCWLLIARRQLAMQIAREKRVQASSQQVLSDGAAVATPPPTSPLPAEPEWDLAALQEQFQRFLRGGTVAATILGLWIIWANVLPALGFLHRVELWQSTVERVEQVDDGNGGIVENTITTEAPTTLGHALLFVAIVTVTVLASRNLPGLLAISVLSRLPMDSGSRHAVTTVCRYVVTMIGMLIGCRVIGLSWSNVHWLAAAMTVGLGFGLQEIFANFVSGLIILFERPIRVGDLVTVGQVTGTVTRMQIRATTITDFDRRELIVPNKKFITDDVINWTLTDPITRVVVSVGVAYGTEIELVHETLMQVARENPGVLEDPAPSVLFAGFAESTLDFKLRVFLPRRDAYPELVNSLNLRIDQLFRERDIQIAFPQRDINIRTIQQMLPMVAEEQQSSENTNRGSGNQAEAA